MISHRGTWVGVVLAMTAATVACSSSGDEGASDENGSALVKDIATMEQDADGTFTVTCKSGVVVRRVTADAINQNRVCHGEYARSSGTRCNPEYSDRNPHGIHECVEGTECLWVQNQYACTDKLRAGAACTADSQCNDGDCDHGKCRAPLPPTSNGPLSGGTSAGEMCHRDCCCVAGYHCSTSDIYRCYPD